MPKPFQKVTAAFAPPPLIQKLVWPGNAWDRSPAKVTARSVETVSGAIGFWLYWAQPAAHANGHAPTRSTFQRFDMRISVLLFTQPSR
jgi:hypothetical protein